MLAKGNGVAKAGTLWSLICLAASFKYEEKFPPTLTPNRFQIIVGFNKNRAASMDCTSINSPQIFEIAPFSVSSIAPVSVIRIIDLLVSMPDRNFPVWTQSILSGKGHLQ
eukprot:Gregarina_sp_Poly_1__100@NODE_1021_length_5328_cov_19_525375_g712_i0_p3_GENE_NODE_1021_length_5328_cov_19_525375_g712_i0NODE_1021_length_5328_cov_19_525375_g712_i0_p3_ORF_typecomplete_len110_score11_15_NODE_1021_length_5328_cov_19_525375_g712_i027533082